MSRATEHSKRYWELRNQLERAIEECDRISGTDRFRHGGRVQRYQDEHMSQVMTGFGVPKYADVVPGPTQKFVTAVSNIITIFNAMVRAEIRHDQEVGNREGICEGSRTLRDTVERLKNESEIQQQILG